MYTLEFGIVHQDCVVNELSRKYPSVKIVCLGGIVLDPNLSDGHTAEEILSIESSNETEILDSIQFLKEHDQISEISIIEKATGKSIVRLLASAVPVTGYCSEAELKIDVILLAWKFKKEELNSGLWVLTNRVS